MELLGDKCAQNDDVTTEPNDVTAQTGRNIYILADVSVRPVYFG